MNKIKSRLIVSNLLIVHVLLIALVVPTFRDFFMIISVLGIIVWCYFAMKWYYSVDDVRDYVKEDKGGI